MKIRCDHHLDYCKDVKKIVLYRVRHAGAYCSHGASPVGHRCKPDDANSGLCPSGLKAWVEGTNYWLPILEDNKELKLKMIKI